MESIRLSHKPFVVTYAILITILCFTFSSTNAQDDGYDNPDKLAYVSYESNLMLYDPRDRTETLLIEDVSSFKIGESGKIAFTRQNGDILNLYVFDPSTSDQYLLDVSLDSSTLVYPLAWSQDGHYLAFGVYQNRHNQTLYIWNGEAIIDIMPDDPLDNASGFGIEWSHDGRLAFQIGYYNWANGGFAPEVYIWDGSLTSNLSQNTEGWDGSAQWSLDGKLLFRSSVEEKVILYIWDGESFANGTPDVHSFIPIASDLKPTYPIWLDNSTIGFTVPSEISPNGEKEIVLWDIENDSVLKRFPVKSDNAWSWLADGRQVVLSSHLASGIPSVYFDVENTEGEILFSEHIGSYAWSPDGFLAYCGLEEGRFSRILSIWDGEESWVVAEVSYKPVQWQNGQGTFSCNNG